MSDLQKAATGYASPDDNDHLNAILQDPGCKVLTLPEPYEQAFRQQYRRRAAVFLRQSVFALIGIYLLVVWPIWMFSNGHPMPTWKEFAMTPIGLVLMTIWVTTKLPFMERHVETTLAGGLTICLCGTIYCTLILGNQSLGQMASYETIYIIIIGFMILRLPVRLAVFCSLLALATGVGAVILSGMRPAWLDVLLFAAVPLLICTGAGSLLESAERRSFVQACLLEIQRQQLEGLNHLVRRDDLSGLANRRHLDETLLLEWERARRDQISLSLVFIDVDYFKRYNDSYGHTAGDKCLALIGRALDSALRRPADLAARYGGEEFVLLLPNTTQAGARLVAERIIATIDELGLPHGNSPIGSQVTVSVGVAACVPEAGQNPQSLIDMADEALYRSKSLGRHRITVADCYGEAVFA